MIRDSRDQKHQNRLQVTLIDPPVTPGRRVHAEAQADEALVEVPLVVGFAEHGLHLPGVAPGGDEVEHGEEAAAHDGRDAEGEQRPPNLQLELCELLGGAAVGGGALEQDGEREREQQG